MKCPVCHHEMETRGFMHKADEGLPYFKFKKAIPYYLCRKCEDKNSPVAFYRTLVEKKWYYFKEKWNFLKEKEFNPSRRE